MSCVNSIIACTIWPEYFSREKQRQCLEKIWITIKLRVIKLSGKYYDLALTVSYNVNSIIEKYQLKLEIILCHLTTSSPDWIISCQCSKPAVKISGSIPAWAELVTLSVRKGERSNICSSHDSLESVLVPGAETDQTGDVVQVAGGQSDAELLVEVENLRAGQLPGLLSLDDSPSLVQSDFHVNI